MEQTLWELIKTLEPLQPRFVSVTYGAGGSTRERTHATVERILKETPLTPAAHLTCVAASRDEDRRGREGLLAYWAYAISSPFAGTRRSWHQVRAASRRYRDAAELVAGLKKVAPFDISVAAYPEVHPDFFHSRVRPRKSEA